MGPAKCPYYIYFTIPTPPGSIHHTTTVHVPNQNQWRFVDCWFPETALASHLHNNRRRAKTSLVVVVAPVVLIFCFAPFLLPPTYRLIAVRLQLQRTAMRIMLPFLPMSPRVVFHCNIYINIYMYLFLLTYLLTYYLLKTTFINLTQGQFFCLSSPTGSNEKRT